MQRIEWWLAAAVVTAHAGAVAALWQAQPARTEPVVMQAVLLSQAPPALERNSQPTAQPSQPTLPAPVAPVPTPAKPRHHVKPHTEPQRPATPSATPVRQSHVVKNLETAAAVSTPVSNPTAARAPVTSNAAPAYQAPTADAQGLNNSAPAYPPTSRKKREQGVVWLEVHVGVQGELLEVKLKTSSGFHRLDDAALRAVKQWRFQPAQRHGQPVAAWYDLPVRFSLTAPAPAA